MTDPCLAHDLPEPSAPDELVGTNLWKQASPIKKTNKHHFLNWFLLTCWCIFFVLSRWFDPTVCWPADPHSKHTQSISKLGDHNEQNHISRCLEQFHWYSFCFNDVSNHGIPIILSTDHMGPSPKGGLWFTHTQPPAPWRIDPSLELFLQTTAVFPWPKSPWPERLSWPSCSLVVKHLSHCRYISGWWLLLCPFEKELKKVVFRMEPNFITHICNKLFC